MEKVKLANAIENLVKINFKEERVLTTKQMSEVYETEENNIVKNFSNNKNRFEEGKHYHILTGEELRKFKREVNDVHVVANNVNKLYLWTEKGANRMCKILDTDKAWEQFEILEDTYFNVKYKTFKPLSPTELLQLQLEAIKENENRIEAVNEDLQNFKVDIPLFGNEALELQNLVRSKGTSVLGGKDSMAYKDKSLRQRLYLDLQREIKRQFGVSTYKAIKRANLQTAKDIIKNYCPPLSLKNEIYSVNAQVYYGDFYEG